MTGILSIIAVATLIEALITYAQDILKKPQLIASVILGVLMAFLFNATFFAYLDLKTYYVADIILSGVLMSRGSNYIYTLFSTLKAIKKPDEVNPV